MIKLFNLRNFRLLTLGGAKASTLGEEDGDTDEVDIKLYFKS